MASVRPLPHPSWSPTHNNNPLASLLTFLPRWKHRVSPQKKLLITTLLTFRTPMHTSRFVLDLVYTPVSEVLRPHFQWSPHAVAALSGLFCFSSSWRVPGKRVTTWPRGVQREPIGAELESGWKHLCNVSPSLTISVVLKHQLYLFFIPFSV